MLASPITERFEKGVQAPTDCGDGVLHARWDLLVMNAFDDAVSLQVAKLLCEHSLGDPWYPPPQLHEPQRPLHDQGVNGRRLPFAGDDSHDHLHSLDGAHLFHRGRFYTRF